MKKKEKKSSSSSKVLSAKEKMIKRKKDLDSKGSGGGLVYPKEGVTRVRLKSPGDDEELAIEVVQFYLGQDIGGIISPATFDEPCPFMDKYKELKSSDDDDDKALAKLLVPKNKYVLGGIFYKDEKGKEVDQDRKDKGMLVARGVYQDIIDLYLDEDEWGDMTSPTEGYDIKITRSGKGKNDTSYSVSPCQKKPLDKSLRGNIDLEKIVRAQIQSYDSLVELLAKFLKSSPENDDEDEPKKSGKGKLLKKKKKSFKRDI